MTVQILPGEFSVCKIPNIGGVDLAWPFTFLSVTDSEISLVCDSGRVPASAQRVESGFRAMRIAGELDFSLVGVIARIAGLLAEQSISLFVLSTFKTDYVLVKQDQLKTAANLLLDGGYNLISL